MASTSLSLVHFLDMTYNSERIKGWKLKLQLSILYLTENHYITFDNLLIDFN